MQRKGTLFLLSNAIYSNYQSRASAAASSSLSVKLESRSKVYTHLCFGAADRARSDGTRLVEPGQDFGHTAVGHEQLA